MPLSSLSKEELTAIFEEHQYYKSLIDHLPNSAAYVYFVNENDDIEFLLAGGSVLPKEGFDRIEIAGKTLKETMEGHPDALEKILPYYLQVLNGMQETWFDMNFGDQVYRQYFRNIHYAKNKKVASLISVNITEFTRQQELLYDTAWKNAHKFRRPVASILGIELITQHLKKEYKGHIKKGTLTDEYRDKLIGELFENLRLINMSALEMDKVIYGIRDDIEQFEEDSRKYGDSKPGNNLKIA